MTPDDDPLPLAVLCLLFLFAAFLAVGFFVGLAALSYWMGGGVG